MSQGNVSTPTLPQESPAVNAEGKKLPFAVLSFILLTVGTVILVGLFFSYALIGPLGGVLLYLALVCYLVSPFLAGLGMKEEKYKNMGLAALGLSVIPFLSAITAIIVLI